MASTQPLFETHPQPLAYLLEQIHNRNLALPDFQRDFVWNPSDTRDLVVSVASLYPAGSLLFLEQTGGQPHFKPREVKGAPELDGREPRALVLDGQQRLTSLYQALHGVGEYRYFIDIDALIAKDSQGLEAALSYLTEKRAEKEYGTIEKQAARLMLPLMSLRDPGFDEWLDEIIELREKADPEFDAKAFKKEVRAAYKTHVKPLQDYSFPVVDLPRETTTEAVCKIFETLNRTGMKLTVFELLVARFWPKSISLRGLWDEAREKHDILEDMDVDPFWLLQSICLRSGGPAPSVQRGDVLKLEAAAINAHWDEVAAGAAGALEMLRADCGIPSPKWLPYSSVIVPMAAIWPRVSGAHGPDEGAAREKLAQYFWCSMFSGAFDSSPNSAAVKHYQELGKWLDGGPEPDVVKNFARSFDKDLLLEAKTGQRALYRSVVALTLRHGALDFHNRKKLDAKRLAEDKIDAHHVFPSAFLRSQWEINGVPEAERLSPDLVLNRALIDKKTNSRIQHRAPSDYLAEMDEALEALPTILNSHLLPAVSGTGFSNDDYQTFIYERQGLVIAELQVVTGRSLTEQPG